VPKYFAQDFLQRVPPAEPLAYRDFWPSLSIMINGQCARVCIGILGCAWQRISAQGIKTDVTVG